MHKPLLIFIEPVFYGLGYTDAALACGCEFVALVSDKNNPVKYGYQGKQKDIIVADIHHVDSMTRAIELSPYYGKIDAIISANDLATYLAAKISDYFGLKATPCSAALAARRKDLAREIYKKNNVPSAKFAKVTNIKEAILAAESIGFPIIIKPTDCTASQHVYLVQNSNELRSIFDKLSTFDETYLGFKTTNEYLIEEYLIGPEFSVEIFLVDKKIGFASVTEKILSSPPFFVEMGHVVPTSIFMSEQDNLIQVAHMAVLALGFTDGSCHVEIRLTKNGPVIIETNGRPGGDQISTDLLINSFGMNMFVSTINYYLNRPVTFPKESRRASAIAYLAAQKDGKLQEIKGLDNFYTFYGAVRYQITAKAGDEVRVPQHSGDRLGYVIVTADTPAMARKLAFQIVKNCEVIVTDIS